MLEAWDFLSQLGIAILCGFVIGLERQINKGLAGIHTNVLVSAGSCLFIFVSLALQDTNSPTYSFQPVENCTGSAMIFNLPISGQGGNNGPARVASQIVSGIGFLGAGVIAKEGITVRGINSAATLWCSAAIGSMCGSGNVGLAMLGTLIIALSNSIVRQKWIKKLYRKTSYNLVIHCPIESADAIIQYVKSKSSTALLNKFDMDYSGNTCVLVLHLIDHENSLESRRIYIQDLAKQAIDIQRCAIEIA